MWSTEIVVATRQWRRNSWRGHNWATGSFCDLRTSLPPTSALPLYLHPVRGRCGICYGERLTALVHITLPAVTIRKEHIPEPGTTSQQLLHSHRHFSRFSSLCPLQYMLKVCIWSDSGGHLNRTEMWLCLTDSNASQMDPITCLIVATSCLPFFSSGSTRHFSPPSQMRQSYQSCLASLYIQRLLSGGCSYFCLAIKSN